MSSEMQEAGATLVLICRRPAAGSGKRRLAAALGDSQTLVIAQALLATALEDAMAWPGPVVIAPASEDDAAWAGRLLTRPVSVQPQSPGPLGERLAGLDRRLRAAGHHALVYIGSDAPALQPDDYAATRRLLARHDVVLVPAVDGGVTLMASRRPWPPLSDLPWETAALGEALYRRCVAAGLGVVRLEERFDVDTAADLERLGDVLADDPRPARRALLSQLARMQPAAEDDQACG